MSAASACAGTLDEPSENDTGQYLALSLDAAANCQRQQPAGIAFADGACQHTVSLTFPHGSNSGIDITFGTNLGTFAAASGLSTDRASVTAKTAQLSAGAKLSFATLIAPLLPGRAEISATAGASRVTQALEFSRATPAGLDLGATVRTFDKAGGRSSDFVVQLRRMPDEGVPSLGTRVEIHSCCPELPGGTRQGCAAYLSTPTLIESSSNATTALPFTARATSEGEAFLAQSVASADAASVYVVALLEGDDFECPQPESDAGSDMLPVDLPSNAVELRWVRRP